MKIIQITPEQAKEMHASGVASLKSIAETNFPELFNQEKKWKDFGEVKGYFIYATSEIERRDSETSNKCNKNTYPTKAEAERELALIQLRQWRDKANGEPIEKWCDWSDDNQKKYCIMADEKTWDAEIYHTSRCELAFKSEEILNQFIKDHKSLIDKAFNL